ncbi:SpoIIE family protein phosphatase [Bacteroidota bacterium]
MKISMLYLIIFSVISNITFAQKQGQDLIDSLLNEILKAKEDTNYVLLLQQLSYKLYSIDPDKGIKYGFDGLRLAEKLKWKNGIAKNYRSLATNYWSIGKYDESLEYYLKALKINEELGDKNGIVACLGNCGMIYSTQGKNKLALEYYNRAYKINEELGNKKRQSSIFINIGLIYRNLNDIKMSLDYYKRALKISEEINDDYGITIILGNIASAYFQIGDINKALRYYQKSQVIAKEQGHNRMITHNLVNFSAIYIKLGEKEDSLANLTIPIDRNKNIVAKNNYQRGLKYGLEAAQIAEEKNIGNVLYLIYEAISIAYRKLGNYKPALEYYEKFRIERDSVFSQESKNKIQLLEFQKEREIKDKEIEIQKLEIEQKEIFIYFAIAGITLIALLAFFIYTRFRIKKKSNIEISRQKENVERAYRNVKMLSEIGQNITSNLTVKRIIETVYDNVSLLMNSTVFGIGVYNNEDNRLDFIGSKELGETLPDFHFDLKEENRLAVLCFNKQNEIMISDYRDEIINYFPTISPPKAGKDTESLLYLPLNTKKKRIGVITIQSFEKNIYTEYHLDILRNLSIYVAIALDNAEAYKQIENQKGDIEEKNTVLQKQSNEISIKNERLIELNDSKDRYLSLLKSELKLAADYVESLIPSSIEEGIVTTRWLYIPTAEVGGDSLGYHWLDDNNFAFYLVDVSGHGVGPALHTVSIMNSIKNETLPDVDFRLPEEVLSALNETFKMKEYNNIYFTMWYGVYNKKKRTLTYSGAGHPPAYLIHGRKTSLLESTNIVVGFKSGFQYKSSTVKIDDPSTIYIYSDGVYEIRKKSGEFWNSKEMYNFLGKENASGNDSDIKSLYKHVKEISGKDVLDDDFSILKLVIE